MNRISKACCLYVFSANNMKWRKNTSDGWKKFCEIKNVAAAKNKIWKNPTDKSLIWSKWNFCQLRFLIHAFLWTGHLLFHLSDFFHEMWIIFAFKKNKWLQQLYIQTYRHILTEGCYNNENIWVWLSNCTYKYFSYPSLYQAMLWKLKKVLSFVKKIFSYFL